MRIEGVSTSTVVNDNISPGQKSKIKDNIKQTIHDKQSSNNERTRNVNEEDLIKAIETANDSIQLYNRRLKFSIHEETKEIMVKVIDTETDEVIKEIPPEKILDMVAKLWEMAGILIDEKV